MSGSARPLPRVRPAAGASSMRRWRTAPERRYPTASRLRRDRAHIGISLFRRRSLREADRGLRTVPALVRSVVVDTGESARSRAGGSGDDRSAHHREHGQHVHHDGEDATQGVGLLRRGSVLIQGLNWIEELFVGPRPSGRTDQMGGGRELRPGAPPLSILRLPWSQAESAPGEMTIRVLAPEPNEPRSMPSILGSLDELHDRTR